MTIQTRRTRPTYAPTIPAAATWPEPTPCAADPELWFSTDPEQQARAVSICAGCPVRAQCLKTACEAGEQYGIWGGVDFETRPSRRGPRRSEVGWLRDQGQPVPAIAQQLGISEASVLVALNRKGVRV